MLTYVTCDELLHPTETLLKINEATEDTASTSNEDIAVVSNTPIETQDTDISEVQSTTPVPKRNLSILKRALLICAPIILIAISVSVYCYVYANEDAKEISEEAQFQLVESRTNVESDKGRAYELIFLCPAGTSSDFLTSHAKSISHAWESGEYKDSTENVLVVSYYSSVTNFNTKGDTYFQILFLKN